ncbi:MAG: glutamyl-tRNA reductase [Bacteroidota bacterium]
MIGVNYKKTDATRRSLFAVGEDQYINILSDAGKIGLTDLFVLSTCNRTEIYGFAEDASTLSTLICEYTEGGSELFNEIAYTKKGNDAMQHFFQVGAGLDSQILGDYEIIGQIKKAVKFSKDHHCMGGYMERLVNAVLQASKEIKSTTSLSGGTVSVSFAAVQYIREQFPNMKGKKIALLGIGKIGKNTCKNLVDYLETKNIVLLNRTLSKASELAIEMGIQFAPMDDLDAVVESSDIIIVATNSQKPVITKDQLAAGSQKLILDLSIPYNVEVSAKELPHIQLVNVDELSKIKDSNLQKRQSEVPKALVIIEKYSKEFIEWHKMRRNVPVLKAIKTKLEQLHQCNIFISYSAKYNSAPLYKNEEKIQKLVNGLAVKMKEQNQQGCYYLEALNEFIATA